MRYHCERDCLLNWTSALGLAPEITMLHPGDVGRNLRPVASTVTLNASLNNALTVIHVECSKKCYFPLPLSLRR